MRPREVPAGHVGGAGPGRDDDPRRGAPRPHGRDRVAGACGGPVPGAAVRRAWARDRVLPQPRERAPDRPVRRVGRDRAERRLVARPGNGPARMAELRWRGRGFDGGRSLRPYPWPLRDLLSVVPDAVLDAVAYSPTAERVAEVLPDVLASWTRDEPGWDTLLAALDVAPAGDAQGRLRRGQAGLAAPGFDVARVADCALFASLVPEDPAAATQAWSSGQVLRAAADMPSCIRAYPNVVGRAHGGPGRGVRDAGAGLARDVGRAAACSRAHHSLLNAARRRADASAGWTGPATGAPSRLVRVTPTRAGAE